MSYTAVCLSGRCECGLRDDVDRQVLRAADQAFDDRPEAQFEPPAPLRPADDELRRALRLDLAFQPHDDIFGRNGRDRRAKRRGEPQRGGAPALRPPVKPATAKTEAPRRETVCPY